MKWLLKGLQFLQTFFHLQITILFGVRKKEESDEAEESKTE